MVKSDKADLIIISRLLGMASEKFSCHGCNDIPDDLFEGVSDEYKKELQMEYSKEMDDTLDEENLISFNDWCLMSFFKRKLRVIYESL